MDRCPLAGALVMGALLLEPASISAADAINVGSGEVMKWGGAPDGFAPGSLVIDVGTLSIAPTGKLNLTNNTMIVRLTPFATVYGYVLSGYNGGAWNGFGIVSSTAAADPEQLTGLGIIDNSEAQFTSFMGRPTLAGTETFVKYTLYGDANLDGVVDGADLALMGGGANSLAGGGTGWYHGDFDYSGTVDATDFALFEAGRISQGGVPEPGSAMLLCAGALGLIGRRRVR